MFAALLSLSASKRLKASITSLFCLIDSFLFDIFWITFCPYNCQEDTENDDTEEEWSGTRDDSNIVYYECRRGKCLHLVQGWEDKGKVLRFIILYFTKNIHKTIKIEKKNKVVQELMFSESFYFILIFLNPVIHKMRNS